MPRTHRLALISLLFLLLACRALFPAPLAQDNGEILKASPPPLPQQPGDNRQPIPAPTTPLAVPSPDAGSPGDTPQTAEDAFRLRVHPDGPLYVGDQVSFEVIVPSAGEAGEGDRVEIYTAEGERIASAEIGPFGIGRRLQATFYWAWDTSGFEPGEYELTFSAEPGDQEWVETITLLPAEQVPFPEPGAHWASTETDCCLVYYITGTAAERDLEALSEMLDSQAESASELLGIGFREPVPVVFLPRVLGHGGFAGEAISVSYLDRNYAGGDPQMILHHELVHILDGRLGGELRPTFFVEGLAVYLSGGHFKPEPLLPRAAALLPPQPGCLQASLQPSLPAAQQPAAGAPPLTCGLDLYIPLRELMDNFYTSQHEIAYLEAAALIQYMVETWGWDAFSNFYRSMKPVEGGSHADAIDRGLEEHFGLGLDELEGRYLQALSEQDLSPELVEDVRLTVEFYDTVRRYQQALDPSAYYLTAWLPDAEEMRRRGIVADYLRHPAEAENLAIETLLVAAGEDLQQGSYAEAARRIAAVNDVLELYAQE